MVLHPTSVRRKRRSYLGVRRIRFLSLAELLKVKVGGVEPDRTFFWTFWALSRAKRLPRGPDIHEDSVGF